MNIIFGKANKKNKFCRFNHQECIDLEKKSYKCSLVPEPEFVNDSILTIMQIEPYNSKGTNVVFKSITQHLDLSPPTGAVWVAATGGKLFITRSVRQNRHTASFINGRRMNFISLICLL